MSILDSVTPLWRKRFDSVLREPSVSGAALVSQGTAIFDSLNLESGKSDALIELVERALKTKHGVRSHRDHRLCLWISFGDLCLLATELGCLTLILLYTDPARRAYFSNLCCVAVAEMLAAIPADVDLEEELNPSETRRPGLGGLCLEKLPRSRTLVREWPGEKPALVFISKNPRAVGSKTIPFQKLFSKETVRIVLPKPRPPD